MKEHRKITAETKLAVWKAEDGRCEMCSRAMDKKVAQVRRVNLKIPQFHADNLHLVCIDCKKGQPDLLDKVTIPSSVIQDIAEKTGMNQETISPILTTFLRKHGVLVYMWQGKRQYWIPGIGKFQVYEKTAEVVQCEFYPPPDLKIKVQERTRGLPKSKPVKK